MEGQTCSFAPLCYVFLLMATGKALEECNGRLFSIYSKVAFAKLYKTKTPIIAADTLMTGFCHFSYNKNCLCCIY